MARWLTFLPILCSAILVGSSTLEEKALDLLSFSVLFPLCFTFSWYLIWLVYPEELLSTGHRFSYPKIKIKSFQPIPLGGDAQYSQVGCSHTTSMCSVDKCGPEPMHFASVLHLEPNTTFPNLAILIPSIKASMFISFVFLTICAQSSTIK